MNDERKKWLINLSARELLLTLANPSISGKNLPHWSWSWRQMLVYIIRDYCEQETDPVCRKILENFGALEQRQIQEDIQAIEVGEEFQRQLEQRMEEAGLDPDALISGNLSIHIDDRGDPNIEVTSVSAVSEGKSCKILN